MKQQRDNWTYEYSPPLGDYNYHYYFTHPLEYLNCVWRNAKYFYQRGTRGYSERDVWSVDCHLSSYMGNALRDLRDSVHGVPVIDLQRGIFDPSDPDCLTMEEWKFTINYLAETFDLSRKIQEYDIPVEGMEAALKRFHHGMAMFTEYYFNLWD